MLLLAAPDPKTLWSKMLSSVGQAVTELQSDLWARYASTTPSSAGSSDLRLVPQNQGVFAAVKNGTITVSRLILNYCFRLYQMGIILLPLSATSKVLDLSPVSVARDWYVDFISTQFILSVIHRASSKAQNIMWKSFNIHNITFPIFVTQTYSM